MSAKTTTFYMSQPVDIHIYTEGQDGSERIEIEGVELFSLNMGSFEQTLLRRKLEQIVASLESKGLGE